VEKRDPELARSAIGFWVVAETRKRPEKGLFCAEKGRFYPQNPAFFRREFCENMLMTKELCDFAPKPRHVFCFSRKSRGYGAGFVVLIWRRGADFWRRLVGPEKLRWKMHGLSMRVSG
jgi:hypothetical protein